METLEKSNDLSVCATGRPGLDPCPRSVVPSISNAREARGPRPEGHMSRCCAEKYVPKLMLSLPRLNAGHLVGLECAHHHPSAVTDGRGQYKESQRRTCASSDGATEPQVAQRSKASASIVCSALICLATPHGF